MENRKQISPLNVFADKLEEKFGIRNFFATLSKEPQEKKFKRQVTYMQHDLLWKFQDNLIELGNEDDLPQEYVDFHRHSTLCILGQQINLLDSMNGDITNQGYVRDWLNRIGNRITSF